MLSYTKRWSSNNVHTSSKNKYISTTMKNTREREEIIVNSFDLSR